MSFGKTDTLPRTLRRGNTEPNITDHTKESTKHSGRKYCCCDSTQKKVGWVVLAFGIALALNSFILGAGVAGSGSMYYFAAASGLAAIPVLLIAWRLLKGLSFESKESNTQKRTDPDETPDDSNIGGTATSTVDDSHPGEFDDPTDFDG